MSIIFNRPRIIPYNPNSDSIVLDDNYGNDNAGVPIRPVVNTSSAPLPQPSRSMTTSDDESPEQMMARLYQPEHRYIDMMDQQIQNMPVRNHPGLARKIFAGIAAGLGGGTNAWDYINYKPYHDEMADWEMKLKPIETAAGLERQNNANMRAVANQIISQSQSDKRLTATLDRNATLERQGDERIANTAERNADLSRQADERIAQRDAEIQIRRELMNGGQLYHNDKTGEAFLITKDGRKIDVDEKYLTAEERSQYAIKTAAASAGARAKATATNQKPRVAKVEYEDPNNPGKTITGSINLDTGEITPGSVASTKKPDQPTAVKGQSELEKSRGLNSRAKKVVSEHPELAKYIKFDTKGNFVKVTDRGYFEDNTKRDQAYRLIYGSTAADTSTAKTPITGKPAAAAPAGNAPPPIEKRTKGMEFKFPNGNVGVWDGTKWVPKTVVTK